MNNHTMISSQYLTPLGAAQGWRVVATADFDGNGSHDLVWQHTDGSLAAWFMNGAAMTHSSYFSPVGVADANWRVIAVR